MRLLYSSEEETFSRFHLYFKKRDIKFATKFKCMLDNEYDPVIEWMKNSLIPFGEQLLIWCDGDGGDTLEQSLYRCNGNLSVCN